MKADYTPYNSYWQLCPMNNNKPQFKDMGFAVRLLLKKKKKKKGRGHHYTKYGSGKEV